MQKEFFQLLVRDLFDPKYGMFSIVEETNQFWFNNLSQDVREFELIGIILGLAIYNSVILDIHFPSVVYKKLMDERVTLSDLKGINPVIFFQFFLKGHSHLLLFVLRDFCLDSKNYWNSMETLKKFFSTILLLNMTILERKECLN